MLEMKAPNRARNPALHAIGAFSLRYSEIPSQVYLGQYIFTGQNWTCACGSSLLTLGTLVCRLVGALYLHIFFFAIRDDIFCAPFVISIVPQSGAISD